MKKIALVCVFVFSVVFIFASWECEWEDMPEENPYSWENMNKALVDETSFGRIAGLGLLRFYQVGFSGKVGGRCVFHPSCSRYGFFAVKKYGLIKGTVMSTDRLFRCHGWSYTCDYPYDVKRSLLSDPVEANNTFNFMFDWINL